MAVFDSFIADVHEDLAADEGCAGPAFGGVGGSGAGFIEEREFADELDAGICIAFAEQSSGMGPGDFCGPAAGPD